MLIPKPIKAWLFQAVADSGMPLGDGEHLEVLTAEQLEQVRRFFPREKFFILGHPRSGTTILGRLVRLHPEVHCNWNARFFNWDGLVARVATQAFDDWLDSQGNRWVYQKGLSTPLVRVLCDYVMEAEAARIGKRIVGDKTPNSDGAQVVEWLYRVYPEARMLFIVRDGRDAVLSKRIRAFIDYPETLSRADLAVKQQIQKDNEPYLSGERSLFTPAWLKAEARAWAQNVRQSAERGQALFGDRYLAVKYEDMLADPALELARVWEFLGAAVGREDLSTSIRKELARNPKADWHEEKAPDLVRGLQRGTRGGWKQVYTQGDRALFAETAGNELADWGYESG